MYEMLENESTSKYKKQLISCLWLLEKQQVIDGGLYQRQYPGETTPCIYGLPKIHKDSVQLRPVVSSISSVIYNIAKYHHLTNQKEEFNRTDLQC